MAKTKRSNYCKPVHVESLTIGSCTRGFGAWDMQNACIFADKDEDKHRCKWATFDGICLNEGALDHATTDASI